MVPIRKTVKKQNKNKKKHVFFCFLWFSPCFFNWPLGGKNTNASFNRTGRILISLQSNKVYFIYAIGISETCKYCERMCKG